MFASNLYISTNAYVVGAQKNRLNLRERERVTEREREENNHWASGDHKRKCLNKTVLPITINEVFDPTNRSAHLSYQ